MAEKKQLVKKIIILLNKKYKNPKTALNYKTAHQLLIATMLSAQCTDKRVNIVTKDLFKKYKKMKDYAKISVEELEKDIRTTGFFRSKAKNISGSSKIIVKKFRSRIPDTMEKLIMLPGVARKTANIILSEVFDKNEGIAVDTHVRRLSQRLGLSENSNPEKIEKDLMEITEKKNWGKVSNLLISHGRTICTARNPKCKACILNKDCPSVFRVHP
ncbi:MAG: endonuclease III [Candidatus Pacebacteria bacterium]|nr:endonuclease III [Candidatus Paceibacterota bacterium]